MNLYSVTQLKDLLERHGFFFKKNLGQNFLLNESTALRIASSAFETLSHKKKTLAVEIGPGAGALTLQLSELFDRVVAIEIDPHLIPILEESLAGRDNVTVMNTDALRFDYKALERDFPDYEIAVCSNLPYYITSELIMRFLESEVPFASVTVLIQKEACARLISKPGCADYGSITAAVSYYARAEKLFLVGPGNFIPKPKVDSAVLRLIPHAHPPVEVMQESFFFKIIRAAFFARRKTLPNVLGVALGELFTKEEIAAALEECGISLSSPQTAP